MARRLVPPPKPKTPVLTVGQKTRRIERLQKCITRLEAFDPLKARKRAPAILELEAAIDKALSAVFGYGTPGYLRYNAAASLDPSPWLAEATAAVARPASGARPNVKLQETREQFAENRIRAIALLTTAIRELEEEIANAPQPHVQTASTKPVLSLENPSLTPRKEKSPAPPLPQVVPPSTQPAASGFLGTLRRYFARWWPRSRGNRGAS
jgi:hypothetical protein